MMSDASTSTTPDQTSDNSHTAFEDCLSSMDAVALGDSSGAAGGSNSSAPRRKSELHFSARTEAMMHSKSQFSSDVEYDIEHSRVHWSELADDDLSEEDDDEVEVNRENWKFFQELMNDPQWANPRVGNFFRNGTFLKLGQKIAEGGQAEIFEILDDGGNVFSPVILKVFKRGTRFSQLQQQWPLGVLRKEFTHSLIRGTMLDDGRFAFVMIKCWGDLRKLIDQAMQIENNNNQGPPFPYEWEGKTLHGKDMMRSIADQMRVLHENDIVHRDLKAANILLDANLPCPHVVVADFECSIGVVGTMFWRALEILLGLKNRDHTVIDFSEKVDVYSYGMTCFEIVSGCLPFEGGLEPCRASYDLVIEGQIEGGLEPLKVD